MTGDSNRVALWVSLALIALCGLSFLTGWPAYSSSGGDAAGNGMARGFHELFRVAMLVAALLSAAGFGLALYVPEGGLHVAARALGWVMSLLAVGLFGVLLLG
ncbi:hypothetical protein [Melittangium boletus]|uniref:hypothetical protein n=1 Tax=Melittangium boletus TaxID=83453 RepID=UPI003DA1D524